MAETTTKPKAETKAPEEKPETKPAGKRLVQAPVALWVQWFSLGMGNEDPRAALVIDHMGPDCCTLEVHEIGGVRVIPACPHLSDPMLILKPEMRGVEPDGAWDYIQGMPWLRPECDRDLDSRETRIVQLNLLHHWAPSQIAKATRTKDEIVREVLAKHAKT
jgi:hypothetical protein